MPTSCQSKDSLLGQSDRARFSSALQSLAYIFDTGKCLPQYKERLAENFDFSSFQSHDSYISRPEQVIMKLKLMKMEYRQGRVREQEENQRKSKMMRFEASTLENAQVDFTLIKSTKKYDLNIKPKSLRIFIFPHQEQSRGAEKAYGKNKKRNKKRKSKLSKSIATKGFKKPKLANLKKNKLGKRKLDIKKKIQNGFDFISQPLKALGLPPKQGRPAKDATRLGFGGLGQDLRNPRSSGLGELVNKRALTSLIQGHDAYYGQQISPFATQTLSSLQRQDKPQIQSFQLKRSDKFEREKQLLLILDDMLEQIKHFSLEDKIVDFIKISENLQHYNLSPKICIRWWDNLKKKLKDLYKRENEFQALCRNEVNVDFWTETIHMFKLRIKAYENTINKNIQDPNPEEQSSLQEISQSKMNEMTLFKKEEDRFEDMIQSYFQLFDQPNKFVQVMEDLQLKVNDSSDIVQQIDKNNKQEEKITQIDNILSELLAEIQDIELEREDQVQSFKSITNQNQQVNQENNQSLNVETLPWTNQEISSLIRGVFRFGENEWSELLEDIDVHQTRTANQIALKWRQIKQIMRKDIKRVLQETKFDKIITKHEWMIAALELLEQDQPNLRDESPSQLYEVLFIDPSKLTPYQYSQLEQQRQQQKNQDQSSNIKKLKFKQFGSNIDLIKNALQSVAGDMSMEENKEFSKLHQDQQITQGVIDLKEFAPHLLDSNTNLKRSYSLNSAMPGGVGVGQNQQTTTGGSAKDQEFVKIIQQLYQQQTSDSMKFLNPGFTNQIQGHRMYSNFAFGDNNLLMQPPQNQIIPKQFPENINDKAKSYNQLLNNRRDQTSTSIQQTSSLPNGVLEFQAPQKKINDDSLNLKKLLLQNNLQRQQQIQHQQRNMPAPIESHVNNVNPEPPVIKPNTLKYVAPPHIQKESGGMNGHASPKFDKASSIGQGGTVFSKPQLTHSKSFGQGNTIINNYFIQNNIQVSNYQSFYHSGNPLIGNIQQNLNGINSQNIKGKDQVHKQSNQGHQNDKNK
ncbi:UNKNOWN [Stylonychia lemnae]|uniref:Myb-like domain-containing protein n=1 Tax=Stylonychia lemnae TaxID=5949 RepID=A0A078BAR7_STYLE|nr:UNKNOWN [Stylonychia lemnae]|eukprot:CDW90352.1 UNKNOWN [Stylonychia lemnae]